MDETEIKVRPFFAKCAVIQSVTVGIVVLAILIITLLSKSYKKKISKYYKKYVLENTSISEVLPKEDKK